MKHVSLFKRATALLCGGLLFTSQLSHAQEADPAWRAYYRTRLREVEQELNKKPGAIQRAGAPAATSVAQRGACDLVTNGGFETQVAAPSRINNMGGGTWASNNPDSNPMTSQVSGWSSPTEGTPEYYALNASNPANPAAAALVNPNTALMGQYPVYMDQANIGLFQAPASSYYGGPYAEYASSQLTQSLTAGQYYAEFYVYRAANTVWSAYGINRGFGINCTASPVAMQNGAGGYQTLQSGSASVLNNVGNARGGAITASSWNRISGQFTAAGGEQYLTVGQFQSDAGAYGYINGDNTRGSYVYVDEVALYRIPTAGQNRTVCTPTNVTLGEGCPIPGATYSWRVTGSPYVFAGTLNPSVNVPSTTSFTLTVTLPDQSTATSTVIITALGPPPTPTFSMTSSTSQCTSTKNYQITNYDSRFNYVISAGSGVSVFRTSPSTFVLQATSGTSSSFTVTITGCGTSTTTVPIDFPAAEVAGNYYCGYSPSYSNQIPMNTYQSLGITNPQGADVGVFLNSPYRFNFTTNVPGFYLTETSGGGTHFILKPGQGITLTATSINAPCPIVGRWAFYAPSLGTAYRVASNPVSSEVQVDALDTNSTSVVPSASAESFEARLYDSFGHQVKTQRSAQGKAVLDVRSLPNGLYILRAGKGKDAISERIQVTH
ncbi:T9SS type A sorting domain-containing protein [Hymenobacter sp. HSC-4F20]|uniref:T9SS type A sorting domain-containing protein n=1 Tax=Hymenobacter sp. HSC-4F20 TaxID=2864135 RepID=UPI001C72B664|nr:T9SS type A sorting domain-containing protein [Hymenobacter sp. HSC-4F20]MBX0293149.1 T9SS type A sorting domain-containing protein [Hymenobacter sp. HSC-4F20]